MGNDFNLVVLISGRGSNLLKLLELQQNYKIIGVISNQTHAPGLEISRRHQVPSWVFPRSSFGSVDLQKQAIFDKVRSLKPDLICLAGYLQLVSPEHTQEFAGKIINIHPSLLPDYAGLDTHRRAIEDRATRHGCSVHYVDATVDTGPVIAQAALECHENETEQELADRVLELEHQVYPWVANGIACGKIGLKNQIVSIDQALIREAQQRNFILPGLDQNRP